MATVKVVAASKCHIFDTFLLLTSQPLLGKMQVVRTQSQFLHDTLSASSPSTMKHADATPGSGDRLVAVIERIKSHVPPDDFNEFKREIVAFLSLTNAARDLASASVQETPGDTKQNTTPFLNKKLVRNGGRLAHVALAASLLGLGL